MDYSIAVSEVLTTNQTISEVASKYNIYKTTLAKKVRVRLNIRTIDDVVRWCSDPCVKDIRKIINHRESTTKYIWNEILNITSFLPKSSGIRERLYYISNNTTQAPTCGCGCVREWNTTTQKDFNPYCSNNKCVYMLSTACRNRENTNMSRRGVKHAYLDPSVKSKRDNTMIQRYGDTSYNKSVVKQASLDILNSTDHLKQLYDKHNSTFIVANILGVSQSYVAMSMQKLNIVASKTTSNFEQQVVEYIQNTLKIHCSLNDRSIISPKELDIYIPSHNVAIECNGIYWHSEKYKVPTYHSNKTLECVQQKVRLIHLFENEFMNTPEIVKSRLSSILHKNQRVMARKCNIRDVPFADAANFFNVTHIQGSCKTMSVIKGLYCADELVACMSFARSRFDTQCDYELIRYSSKLFTNVVGGASKLFHAFLIDHPGCSIVSYSDNRWNTGQLYSTLGFAYSHTSPPNYHYFKDGYTDTLMSRVSFQKHKLSKMLDKFDSNLSEYANMKVNGYNRIWDCGSTVWKYL